MAQATFTTDRELRALPEGAEPYTASDLGHKGLVVRVYPTGRKVFRWNGRRVAGKIKPLVIGDYRKDKDGPGITLAEARIRLDAAKSKNRQGMDSVALLERPKTINDLAEQFYRVRILPKRDHPQKVRQALDADILPAIGHLPLNENLKTIHLRPPVTAAVNRGSPTQARTVLTVIKQMIGYATSNGYLENDISAPLKGDDMGAEGGTRDRTLAPDEIHWLWHKLDGAARLTTQARIALKVLLLTGVRSGELRRAKWADMDLDAGLWSVPVENQKTRKKVKNPKPFIVPLTTPVVELLRELKKVTGEQVYVLASPAPPEDAEGYQPIDRTALKNSVGRMIDAENRARAKKKLEPVEHFVPHDLRRTMRTLITEKCDVQPHVAELCLGHSLGGIFATYDTGTYLEDRRKALEAWSAYVDRIVHPVANVTEIDRRAAS